MRFFRIRELFAPKNISAALLSLTPPQKNADNHLIGVIYQNLRHQHRLSPYRLSVTAPPPYETYSFLTIRSDVVGFGTGSIILSIYVTP